MTSSTPRRLFSGEEQQQRDTDQRNPAVRDQVALRLCARFAFTAEDGIRARRHFDLTIHTPLGFIHEVADWPIAEIDRYCLHALATVMGDLIAASDLVIVASVESGTANRRHCAPQACRCCRRSDAGPGQARPRRHKYDCLRRFALR
jgi:hypothetical protein